MSAQLTLASLPVADPEFARATLWDLDLERVLEAVSTATADDGKSAPTTRTIAEAVFCEGEEQATVGGAHFVRAARALTELHARGLVVNDRVSGPYFARHDESTVTMWWMAGDYASPGAGCDECIERGSWACRVHS